MGYILGIDQGTTQTTALVLNEKFKVTGRGSCPTRQVYPSPGRAEQDPELLWRSFVTAAELALKDAGIPAGALDAVGIDHQGETCLIWDKSTLRPVAPALGWQDRRTADVCEALRREHGDYILRTTGLVTDSYYSATKLRWLLDNVPGAADAAAHGRLEAGTVNTYLMRRLCGVFATDACTGGRYMLMDLRKTQWDAELCELCGIPPGLLPPIYDCAGLFGYTDPECFFGVRIPVYGSISDSNASLLGSGICEEGVLKASYGTGCFMSLYTGKTPYISGGELTATCCRRLCGVPEYTVCGAVYSAGSAVDWLRRVGLAGSAGETEALAASAKDTGVYFVPAMSGMGTPYWSQDARAVFCGIGADCGREELVRAVLDGVAYRVCDCVDAMRRLAGDVGRIVADGGMSDNSYLMQFQADMTGLPVLVLAEKETSAYGAACLAAIGAGRLEKPSDITELVKLKRIYEPSPDTDKREALLCGWEAAKRKCLLNN